PGGLVQEVGGGGEAAAAAGGADQVAPEVGRDRPIDVGPEARFVPRDDRVADRQRAGVVIHAAAAAADGHDGVAADSATGDRRRADIIRPAPAVVGGVAAEGAVGERRRTLVIHPAAVAGDEPGS